MGVLGDQKEGIFLFLHNKKNSRELHFFYCFFTSYIGIIPITIPVINITIVVPTAQSKVKR